MATEIIEAPKLYQAVKKSFDRMQHYRKARAMFVKAATGKYYNHSRGLVGDEPINLAFNTIRVMVPNTVMKNPAFEVRTDVPSQKEYAELLGLAITQDALRMNLKQVLREWLVDSYFGFGIVKTALQSAGQFLMIDDKQIDPGQLYVARVDLDNFVFDPYCNEPLFRDAMFTGDLVTVPRQSLLDVNGYDNDLIMKLPRVDANPNKKESVAEITGQSKFGDEFARVRDLVQVVQLWVPDANAKIIMPDPRVMTSNNFIAQFDYFGPDEGPYDYLTLTQPVSGNPLPVAPASIWHDLHIASNKIFSKMLSQAERQKDVLLYHPAHVDEALDIMEAADGDVISTSDPTKFNMVSFGGANEKTESMVSQLQTWFNYTAGNPDQLAGQGSRAKTATQAQLIDSNANVTLQDSRDILHDNTSSIGRKIAFYKDTDPLLDNPLTTRNENNEEIFVRLTADQRRGDFDAMFFKTVAKSMVRLSPQLRATRMMELASNVIPAVAQAALISLQMGWPFNFPKFMTKFAQELDMGDWINDIFDDPDFAKRQERYFQMAGGSADKGNPINSKSIAQNGGFPMNKVIIGPEKQARQDSQATAALSQQSFQGTSG